MAIEFIEYELIKTWLQWGFPKSWGTPLAGWFVMENVHLEIDDLGVPPFMETTKFLPTIGVSVGQNDLRARCGLWNDQLAQTLVGQCLEGIEEFSTAIRLR